MSNVKLFRSTDYGAPALYGAAGGLINVLDACLINGYGQQSITSLTHLDGVVTATTPIAHNLNSYSRQTIAGANEAGYNGEFVIMVTGPFTFTYNTTGVSINTATGTITTMSASAGWTKAFSGTNLAAYRQNSGNMRYLRIDDTATSSSRCTGYESMTGISTGTGQFPTTTQVSGGLYWQKSNTTDTISRPWIIIADDKLIYMWVNHTLTMGTYSDYSMMGFGDFISYKGGDAYNTMISANTGNNSYNYMYFMYLNAYVSATTATSAWGMYSPRSHSQIGSSVALGKLGDYSKGSLAGMGSTTGTGLPYPHPVDGGLYMSPVFISEGATTGAQGVLRGYMTGIMTPLHNFPLNQGDIFEGNGELTGKTFLVLIGCPGAAAMGQCMVDISLTW